MGSSDRIDEARLENIGKHIRQMQYAAGRHLPPVSRSPETQGSCNDKDEKWCKCNKRHTMVQGQIGHTLIPQLNGWPTLQLALDLHYPAVPPC